MAAAKSAKRKRSATKTHPNRDGTVLNVETNLLIASKSVINGLLEDKKEAQKKVRKINDAFGVKFSNGQAKSHVHKGAANIYFNLAGLDDEDLHRTLYHLFFYIKDGGLLDRAKKQEELFTAGETGPAPKLKTEGDEEQETDETETNGSDATTTIGAAAREVAEKAGALQH